MRSGWTGPRRRRWRLWRAGCWPSRSRWYSPPVSRARSSGDCRSCWSGACVMAMRRIRAARRAAGARDIPGRAGRRDIRRPPGSGRRDARGRRGGADGAAAAGARARLDLLLAGISLVICEGYPAGAPVLRRAVSAFRGADVSREEGLRWLWLACRAALIVWDYASFDMLSDRQVTLARDAGALIMLPIAFNMRSTAHLYAGEFTEAASPGAGRVGHRGDVARHRPDHHRRRARRQGVRLAADPRGNGGQGGRTAR